MTLPRPITSEEAARLAETAWSAIAPIHASLVDRGEDASFRDIILPGVMQLLGDASFNQVLDAGCGAGRMTRELSYKAGHVTGVDPDPVSIALAAEYLRECPNVTLVQSRLEDYAPARADSFDAVVAAMVAQDVVDSAGFFRALATLLAPRGLAVVVIPHPCFWPRYWDYENETWFRYQDEIYIASDFRTRSGSYGVDSMHVHRPLARYVEQTRASGLIIERMQEEPKQEAGRGRSVADGRFLFMRLRRAPIRSSRNPDAQHVGASQEEAPRELR